LTPGLHVVVVVVGTGISNSCGGHERGELFGRRAPLKSQ